MKKWLAGSLSGFVATAPMTVAMLWMHHYLPRKQQYALPPAEITARLAERAGDKSDKYLESPLGERRHEAESLLAHFGFGAAAGALYAPASRWLPGPPILRGMLFGLGVWAANYLGLLPAAGLLRSATEHPARRNALMIVAHLIWGAALGALTERLED